jgi:predicted O-methyltransferase YrrM
MLKINNSAASAVYTEPEKHDQAAFPYIDFIEKNFIYPTLRQEGVKDILAVGAGGLTVGLKDDRNNYIFLDIDPALDNIARRELLGRDLPPNKKFIAEEARAFLAGTQQKFDFIFLDIYQDKNGVPMHTVTQEFLQQLKSVLKPGGIIAGNFVAAPNFSDTYSIRLDQTVRSVFPSVNRQVVPFFNAWNKDPETLANVVYVMYDIPPQPGIYTDNLNRSFLDKGKEP